jgi:urocanate hydratase
MGFGPFRWVCTSGRPEDLKMTDQIACEIIDKLTTDENGRDDTVERKLGLS